MSKSRRVLIVDDSDVWRETLSLCLPQGYDVYTAESWSEANEKLKENLVHLMILDISLDAFNAYNEDGLDLLRALARDGTLGGYGVIILSAFGSADRMREFFGKFGVADFLDKTNFDGREFLGIVESVFDERIRRNVDLRIDFDENLSLLDLVTNLSRFFPDEDYLEGRIETELLELLGRLFFESKSVCLRNQNVFKLSPVSIRIDAVDNSQPASTYILQFGPWPEIDTNSKQDSVSSADLTPVQTGRTPLLGGILYSVTPTAFDFYQRDIERLRDQVLVLESEKERISRFIAIAGHEINGPLLEVSKMLELLVGPAGSTLSAIDRERDLKRASLALTIAFPMVTEMLEFVGLESGIKLSYRAYDVASCVENVLDEFTPLLQQKHLDWERGGIPSAGVEIECDPLWLTRAIRPVVKNAILYTETGSIKVAVETIAEEVSIVIADTGRGINRQALPRICEFRFRGDDSPGHGIGLYIAKTVVELHGGEIRAESEVGKGTTIQLHLPRYSVVTSK